LNMDGTLDMAFNPNANGFVSAIAVQADGTILAGGDFNGANSIGGQTRNFIARLDSTTGLADSFDPNANLFVRTIVVQADGKILAGGYFNGANSIGGQARNRIARLDATTGLADSFNPNANNIVRSIAVQADGKILVGGFFSGANSIGGQTRNFIARLDATTGLADSFDPNANDSVLAIAVQAGGKILAGGALTTLAPNGGTAVTRNRMARLETDGRLDRTLNLNTVGNFVLATAVQPDGKILIGGTFTTVLGVARNNIARLNPDGTLDTAFNPNANGSVPSIAVQPDGKILAGGGFTSIGGQTRNHIARLDPTTGLADSFDPNANSFVESIAVQADGKILAGGSFAGANSIGAQTRNRIARLDPSTGLADSFDPNANGLINSIAVQADGKILAGGQFSNIGGQTRNLFARLSNDTAALQNLAVTQTTITWTRGGSSPQFTRAAFEYSNDNVNYTPLGDGTAAGSNWILTGLNLPTEQDFYIRARGCYRSGYLNASESTTESVRNAFIGPFQLTAAASRKRHGSAGTFDVNLPLSGEPGLECRNTNGRHMFVFTFSTDVVSGSASVTGGTGGVFGNPIFSGNTMTVNLTGVTDVQKITVTLSDVTSSTSQVLPDTSVSANMLIGDTTADKTVSSVDVSQTRGQVGQPVTNSNFREDVRPDGSINATDVRLVRSNVGHSLP
jgi:uncharacterized delta-60 repeat protein